MEERYQIGSITSGYRVIRPGGEYDKYFPKPQAQDFRARNTSALADERPEVRQAMGLRSAMNPSGISWLMWSDGTNEDAIAQIAAQIQDLDTVARAYRNLYSDDLLKDLQSELSTALFNSFLQTVSNNRINSQSGNPSVWPDGFGGFPFPLILPLLNGKKNELAPLNLVPQSVAIHFIHIILFQAQILF